MTVCMSVPTTEQAKADLDGILATLSAPELLACRDALRAKQFDGRSNSACLLAIVAQQRGLDSVWDVPGMDSLRPAVLWLAAYIHSEVWTERHQLLDDWLSAALDALWLEQPTGERCVGVTTL